MKITKKRLSPEQEFEIMKIVLDKFLWLGFGIMAFGLYNMLSGAFSGGFTYVVLGAVVLILFMLIIVKEYEITR